MILDGWGLGTDPKVSAIAHASTPFMDRVWQEYPHSRLEASGLDVGLPAGQMGNSEVGHMNIGAGRVVYQDLVKINKSIEENTLKDNPILLSALDHAKKSGTKIHLMGLVSDGGVHSHIDHLKGLCAIVAEAGLGEQLFIHAFTDGRDCDPQSGIKFITDMQKYLNQHGGQMASVVGRYFAMDRDQRWERVKKAYDALVLGIGQHVTSLVEGIGRSYEAGITDEFIEPLVATDDQGIPKATIESGDTVICFNFRTDRGRQITQVLTQNDFEEFGMHKLDLNYVTLTNYDQSFEGIKVVFEKDNLQNTLGEVLSANQRTQIRIAETEKYPHVTFFFSGGREEPFTGEKRILSPSPKVATYDLQPEMSANEIVSAIIPEIEKRSADFICLNFANPDMVGHTGVFDAAVQACEVVDTCAAQVTTAALEANYATIIIADHGNSDILINEDGTPNTAHTTNLVPCVLIDNELKPALSDGKLGDLAPTILKLMGIDPPVQMTGKCLI